MTPILQTRLPEAIWVTPTTARMPGILPVAGEDWLRVPATTDTDSPEEIPGLMYQTHQGKFTSGKLNLIVFRHP